MKFMSFLSRATAATVITLAATTSARASISLNWIDWDAPASYPESATYGSSYNYAASTTGSITLINNSVVGVTLSGEVVNPSTYVWATATSIYGTPTGFATVGNTTTSDYWDTRPATNASTFSSAYATPPTNGDHIGLIGAGSLTQTITFSEPVTNIVMAIYSLGNSGVTASWDFNQDFTILSDNLGASNLGYIGGGLTKTSTGGINRLSGNEGSGTIQFLGTFETLSWTVSAPESWASWNVGVSSEMIPEPSSSLLGLLASALLLRRRRVG